MTVLDKYEEGENTVSYRSIEVRNDFSADFKLFQLLQEVVAGGLD